MLTNYCNVHEMKFLLVILALAVSAQAAIIPDAELANLRHYIEVMQDAAKHSKEQADAAIARADVAEESNNRALVTLAKEHEHEISIQAAHIETLKEAAKVQHELDTANKKIADLEKSNEHWKTFGNFVLICVAGLTFLYAWQLIGKLKWFASNPWSLYYRAGISLAVAGAVSYGLFYAITRLL
jgi:hypothetical protein